MDFGFDPRALDDNIRSDTQQRHFENEVLALLNRTGNVAKTDPLFGAVVGMLVLDGATDSDAAGFTDAFWSVRGEAEGKTLRANKNGVKSYADNVDIYRMVVAAIKALPGHTAKSSTLYYQQVADISRKLIENAEQIPVADPNFKTQIRIYNDEYVADGAEAAGGLDIPDLTSADSAAAPDDIRGPNIQGVAVVAASYNLDQAGVFGTVDRIMETWWNGQLPIGFGRASQALDELYWSSEFRLSPSARFMQYGRVLGMPGGEVSTEVQPNTEFWELFRRFVANLAEYDRQRRIGDVVGSQRSNKLTLTAEQVRQSGRNLAANASVYGWGGTPLAARRMAVHIKKAFDILRMPEIQAAYGVNGPYQVVERVSQELGTVPNIVKWRALAEASKNILDLVAKYADKWHGSTGKPLFNDDESSIEALGTGFGTLGQEVHWIGELIAAHSQGTPAPQAPARPRAGVQGTADIDDADRDELIRQAGNYIAVNGMQDETLEQLSQPTETHLAPSIPGLTAMTGPAASSNGGAGLDQLRQMVAEGQVPSLDQLKSFVMPTP